MAITELTQSMVNMYSRCGYQFYMRYIKGIVLPPGVSARKGSSVHAGAEHGYRTYIATGSLPPVDEVTDAARDEFVKLVNDEGVWLADDEVPDKNEILRTAQTEAIASAKSYRVNIAPTHHKVGLVEERLYADLGMGVPISGKPDVVADHKMPDIKTAGKRWSKGVEQHKIQPVLYNVLLRENGYGSDIEAEFIVMTNPKSRPKDQDVIWDKESEVCIDIRRVPYSKEKEDSVLSRVRTTWDAIQKGGFPPADPEHWVCTPQFCGYASKMCPYYCGAVSVSVPTDI